jgi:predicted dehydrogenase
MVTRVGIVGYGWWGAELARGVAALPGRFEIAACATPNGQEREAFSRHFGAPAVADMELLLNDRSIDAVLLATPHSLHSDQIRLAAAAGKHVFCEKPLSLTKRVAELAVAAAERHGIVLAVGYNRRFSAGATKLHEYVQSGTFGTILHVEGNISSPSALRYSSSFWRARRSEAPAGGLASMGVHALDLMLWLLGPVRRVACLSRRRAVEVDIDDTTAILLDFDSGATGTLGSIFATPLTSFLHIYGTAGIARTCDDFTKLEWVDSDGRSHAVDLARVDTVIAELEAFSIAIEGEAPFPVRNQDAIRNVVVLEAIASSAEKNGSWVEL